MVSNYHNRENKRFNKPNKMKIIPIGAEVTLNKGTTLEAKGVIVTYPHEKTGVYGVDLKDNFPLTTLCNEEEIQMSDYKNMTGKQILDRAVIRESFLIDNGFCYQPDEQAYIKGDIKINTLNVITLDSDEWDIMW